MARNRGEPFAKNEKNRAEISSDSEGGEKCESRRRRFVTMVQNEEKQEF